MSVTLDKYTWYFSARLANGKVVILKRKHMTLPQIRRMLVRRKLDPTRYVAKLVHTGFAHRMTVRDDGSRSQWHIEPDVPEYAPV